MLEDFMRDVPVGETRTYEQLSEVVAKDVRPGGPAYHNLKSAINALEREEKTFGIIRKVGVMHLRDEDVPSAVEGENIKARKACRRALKKSRGVKDYEKLPIDKKVALDTQRTIAALVLDSTTSGKRQAITGAVAACHKQLSLTATLDAIRNGS